MKSFTLEIITQEKHVLTETVISLTLMTESGEITILADHMPLFSRLVSGELTYRKVDYTVHFAVTGGFIDVGPRNIVTILADSAIRSDEINLQKIDQAIANAKEALKHAPDQQTTLKIEMELRLALMQQHVAKKHHSLAS